MAKLPSSIVGIDMGNFSWKGVRLDRKGAQYALVRAATVPSLFDPKNSNPPTEQAIAAKIRELASQIRASGTEIHFSVNSMNSTVRYVELPSMPLGEIRTALKINSAAHLRQNFDNYTFDACPLEGDMNPSGKGKKGAQAAGGKIKMMVSGISAPEVMQYFHASRRAGLKPRSLQLSAVSILNAFEASMPEVFQNQAVVILDFGFLSSTLTILDKGKPLLTRAVPTGARQITEYIAQVTSCDFSKAESMKLSGDPTLSEAVTRTSVTMIREIRSSINFFEKNSEIPVSKVYLTGGSISSPQVVEALSKDIGTPCEVWDPTPGVLIELSGEQLNQYKQNFCSYAVALGAARTYTVAPASAKPMKQEAANPTLTKTQVS